MSGYRIVDRCRKHTSQKSVKELAHTGFLSAPRAPVAARYSLAAAAKDEHTLQCKVIAAPCSQNGGAYVQKRYK